MAAGDRSWLDSKHPAYTEMRDEWEMNERRMLGGRGVLSELVPFDWEISGGEHYTFRQNNAVYLNFPDRFASMIVGHMMRQAPEVGNSLNFGTLGEVRRLKDIDFPSEAELLYYNTDGVGNDGSQWNNYWTTVGKATMATGLRWILAEGPPEAPTRRRDEVFRGLRPYLTDYSPIAVPNWLYENGRLSMAIIKRKTRRLRLDSNGALEGNDGEEETLLLTREGFDGFGEDYAGGGWFVFNASKEPVEKGTYELTGGEIPLVPLYYERVRTTEKSAMFARSAITELGNASVAYMNIASAADFDAFDGASSVQVVLGADEKGFNVMLNKMKLGNRIVPLPAPDSDTPKNPQIQDASTGVVVADVFDRRLKAKRDEAIQLMLNELQAAPYASGESKKVSFTDTRAPRLALFASELETAQNTMIHFVEALWGKSNPSGSTEWPREFDLLDAAQIGKDYFEIQEIAGVKSPTASVKAMMLVTKGMAISGDDEERNKIQSEFEASAQLAVEMQKAELKKAQQEGEPPPAPATRSPAA